MVVLDTSFLVDILRNAPRAVELLVEIEGKEPTLLVAAPTVMELWEGALGSKASEKEKARVDALLTSVNVLYLDVRAAKRAAELDFELSGKGTPLELQDIMIAAIAMANGETVVTKDSDYARIPGLKILKY